MCSIRCANPEAQEWSGQDVAVGLPKHNEGCVVVGRYDALVSDPWGPPCSSLIFQTDYLSRLAEMVGIGTTCRGVPGSSSLVLAGIHVMCSGSKADDLKKKMYLLFLGYTTDVLNWPSCQ